MSMDVNRNHRVREATKRTLGILDNIKNIDVGPYFFERLRANLAGAGESREASLLRLVLDGRLAPILLAVVLLANILTAAVVLRTDHRGQVAFRNQGVEALADEYLLTGTTADFDNGTE